MFCDANCISSGSVHYQNAAARCGVKVNIIDANSCASDDAKIWRGFQNLRGDLRGAANDERVCCGETCDEFVARRSDYFPSGFAQEFESALTDWIGNDDIHGWISVWMCERHVKLLSHYAFRFRGAADFLCYSDFLHGCLRKSEN
jgi:hypothetical protein